jgi:ribonucleoside-triphosphate reductase
MKEEEVISEYIEETTWRTKANANQTRSFAGLKAHIAETALALDMLRHSPIRAQHQRNILYIHKLDGGRISPYCCGLPLQQLLQEGLYNPNGVSSAPPKHLDSALDQVYNYTFLSQAEFTGAQAFNKVDTLMMPYIEKDNLKYDAIKQSLQRTLYNLNMPLRSEGQSSFSNWTLDFYQDNRRFNAPLIELLTEGSENGTPFTFPLITIFTKNIKDWDNYIVNKLFEYCAKYGGGYFSNEDPNICQSMCCRLRIDLNEIQENTRGLWMQGDGTGSIGMVTLNLPHIFYVEKSEKKIYNRLDELIELAVKHLLVRRKYIEMSLEDDLLPVTKHYIRQFNRFFNTIGVLGMNEALLNAYEVDILDGLKIAEEYMIFISDKILEMQKESGYLINFEEAPAESLAYTAALHDKKQFPDIITQGTEDIPYYTNSTHIPVNADIDLVTALNHQECMKKFYTGGSIFHIFSDGISSSGSIKKLVRRISENYDIPYFCYSPRFSICKEHGRLDGVVDRCPECGKRTQVFSRIVGYYRAINSWNDGKVKEFEDRQMFGIQ